MIIPSWISFLIILGSILLFSKYELSIILTIAALVFGFLTQVNLIDSIFTVFIDPSIVLLAIAVFLIPILGGILEESGMMIKMIRNMNISKRLSLITSPALFGLLPVAGGALMSAPIVDQVDKDLNESQKVGINVWFRHVVILIYPLSSALIVGTFLAGLNLYSVFLWMILPFIILSLVGYFFLVRNVKEPERDHERNLKKVFINMIPIITAPIIDFIGRTFFNIFVPEIFLVIGLLISILLSVNMAKLGLNEIKKISKKMKIWRFPLLIIGMFLFLEIFQRSGVPEEISLLNLPFFLFLLIGFFLGFATGRIQLPLSILVPIYLVQYTLSMMPMIEFLFLYIIIFLGYLITPIHPCVSYSTNYFETDFRSVLRKLIIPTSFSLILFLVGYLILSIF